MKDYSNNKPEFHVSIQIVDTSTPDNGDNISLADRQNHDNTVVLKKMVDELSTKSETLERKAETLESKSGGLKFLVSDNGVLTIKYPDGNAGGMEKELKFENNKLNSLLSKLLKLLVSQELGRQQALSWEKPIQKILPWQR